MLAPPPPPLWKPKKSGGIVGGLGVGLAIRTKFVPHPVCNLMLFLESRKVLARTERWPATLQAIDQGRRPWAMPRGIDTNIELRPEQLCAKSSGVSETPKSWL
jgi:hypothetical protein